MANSEMLPMYDTKTFAQIYKTDDDFYAAYQAYESILGLNLNESRVKLIYLLLSARYANSPIANYDETQFERKVFTTIYMYAPTWIKRLDIQEKLRGLSDDDLITGTKAIFNHAYNPGTAPSTSSLEELEYINEQNSTNYKKSKMEAYATLWELLATDVTSEFISKFQPLFMMFTNPSIDYIYVTNLDDSED